jgi:hypothetical protein
MQLNGISYSARSSRPHVLSRVGLFAHFIGDGQYVDPYQISAVTIFAAVNNYNPSSVIDSNGEVDITASASILMNFANSAALTSDSSFNTSNYTPGTTASGIFKTATGKYIVILDGTVNLSGNINLSGLNTPIANGVSAASDYIDIWTVRLVEGSDLTTFINNFTLKRGVFTVLTEPVRVSVYNKLVNNRVVLGSSKHIKVTTDVNFENKHIDSSLTNTIKDSIVVSASMLIEKLNEDSNLPSRVTVSGYTDTSALTEIASDNTISLLFDTNGLSTHPRTLDGTLGSLRGAYQARVKYTVFDEIIVSQPLVFIVE